MLAARDAKPYRRGPQADRGVDADVMVSDQTNTDSEGIGAYGADCEGDVSDIHAGRHLPRADQQFGIRYEQHGSSDRGRQAGRFRNGPMHVGRYGSSSG
jgi:hypothetical protein